MNKVVTTTKQDDDEGNDDKADDEEELKQEEREDFDEVEKGDFVEVGAEKTAEEDDDKERCTKISVTMAMIKWATIKKKIVKVMAEK